MWISKEKHRALRLKTAVSIMNATCAGSKADLVKILSAVGTCSTAVAFNLKNIEAFQFQICVKAGDFSHRFAFHLSKL
jgi:hypothetical protein